MKNINKIAQILIVIGIIPLILAIFSYLPYFHDLNIAKKEYSSGNIVYDSSQKDACGNPGDGYKESCKNYEEFKEKYEEKYYTDKETYLLVGICIEVIGIGTLMYFKNKEKNNSKK